MRISTFFYCAGQGIKNIFRNIWYSLASAATIAACVFLFCILYSVTVNAAYMTIRLETKVGITVFFDEGMPEEEILSLGETIKSRPEVASVTYTSAEKAWETFKQEYFSDSPELAEGFAGDNPLADSASFEIFLKDTAMQKNFVNYLKGLKGVRRVNYSDLTADGLTAFRNALAAVSLTLIAILAAVSLFLIGNTVAAGISVRKDEIRIMRWIGAENSMIRAPFLIEGMMIGLFGCAVPLAGSWAGYQKITVLAAEKLSVFSEILEFLPARIIFRILIPAGLILGVGMGFLGSRMALRRHLKV